MLQLQKRQDLPVVVLKIKISIMFQNLTNFSCFIFHFIENEDTFNIGVLDFKIRRYKTALKKC